MPPKRDPQARRNNPPDFETNIAPDAIPVREPVSDPPDASVNDPVPSENPVHDKRAVGGGFTPAEDGGVGQHPIHDSDIEDRTPGDYEREIDRLDAAARVS